jgi:hypothetical protein
MVNGEWQKVDELEPIVESYEVVKWVSYLNLKGK